MQSDKALRAEFQVSEGNCWLNNKKNPMKTTIYNKFESYTNKECIRNLREQLLGDSVNSPNFQQNSVRHCEA